MITRKKNTTVSLEDRLKPELYTDEEINRLATKVYQNCADKDCYTCPLFNEVEEETCKVHVLNELWRKWQNAKMYELK